MSGTTDVSEESNFDPDAVPLIFLDDERRQPTKKQKIPADLESKVEEEEETAPPLEISKPIPLPDTVDVPVAAAASEPKQTKKKGNKSKNYPAVVYTYGDDNNMSFPFLKKKDPRDVHLFRLLNSIGGEKEGEGFPIKDNDDKKIGYLYHPWTQIKAEIKECNKVSNRLSKMTQDDGFKI